jgi:hypothetical protein
MEVNMTIIEAINKIDTLKPNSYTQLNKIEWLSALDGRVKVEIIDTHEGGSDVTFSGYDENTSVDTELLVPAPYDDVYLKWLEAQIDYYNAEYGKYNNTITAYNTLYASYMRYYNRQNMPKKTSLKFF